ncbi:DUF4255 domain-containing protein [Hymenobacter jejuensis]|uniref:DUF4255 domain-containing protein n=1 Tax=Hymenobacter jejuensis TaxID=2502781 RepID=A0A5B8A4P0_9BACT|nr:DUF4255 domain-containing protein [Hymenobacter jejuensis]QDA61603.1 DUF4255 domain-containing protein [Hymenobacter jejuensis]
MISHALTIVVNELNKHLAVYGPVAPPNEAKLGNLAEGLGGQNGGVPRDRLILSVVNIREEKALKNIPNYVRNDTRLTVTYENPPVFLNFQVLMAATHSDYVNALLILSRGIRFFQAQNVFTPDSVAPESITQNAPTNPLDQLEGFKLIFDLYSPMMEEVSYLWGTLGGKQFPFVLYTLRMLDLKFRAVQSESGLITEIDSTFFTKPPVGQ